MPTVAVDTQRVADQLLAQTARIRRAGRRLYDRPRELDRLTGAQLELVRLVRRRPGVSVADAAQELGLAANTVSTLVRRLASDGVLMRRPDALDRRVARLEVSGEIDLRVGAWRDRRVVALGRALAGLSDDEQARLEAALPVLARLADAFETPEQAP